MSIIGRPCELTTDIARKLAEALRTGAGVKTACGLAQISTETYRLWMRAGQEGDPRYTAFFALMSRARSEPDAKAWKSLLDKMDGPVNPQDDRWKAAQAFIRLRQQGELLAVSKKAKKEAIRGEETTIDDLLKELGE